MTIASDAEDSGARRRRFMEGRSAERLTDEIRQKELARMRGLKRETEGKAPARGDQSSPSADRPSRSQGSGMLHGL
jgi:hypothetical protein